MNSSFKSTFTLFLGLCWIFAFEVAFSQIDQRKNQEDISKAGPVISSSFEKIEQGELYEKH